MKVFISFSFHFEWALPQLSYHQGSDSSVVLKSVWVLCNMTMKLFQNKLYTQLYTIGQSLLNPDLVYSTFPLQEKLLYSVDIAVRDNSSINLLSVDFCERPNLD